MSGKLVDLTGKEFGKWTALSIAGRDKRGELQWNCICKCGKTGIILSSNLRNGKSASCGTCYPWHGMYNRPTYESWSHMIQRCTNPVNHAWDRYGGRGIRVCERWMGEGGFIRFFEDMGERPEGKSLDRWPNPDGNYEPGNCRWATSSEQNTNKKRTGKTDATRDSGMGF